MKPRIRRSRRRRHTSPSNEPFFQKEGREDTGTENSAPFFNTQNIQPKLEIGSPNDPAEKQADSMADRVVQNKPAIHRMEEEEAQAKLLHRQEEEEEAQTKLQRQEEEEEELQMKVQRQPEEEEEAIQAKAETNAPTPTRSFESQLKNQKGKGTPLPKATLKEMNRAFGYNFENVAIHTDRQSVQLNQQIRAQAFTHGKDIYFNKGKFNPESSAGKHLLAHELTHVVQQNKSLQREPEALSRACEAGTSKSWSEKVTALEGLSGEEKNNCFVSLIKEALGSGTAVHESTNTAADLEKAIEAGHYTKWGTNKEINFDANFNTKTGNPNQYGEARFVDDGKTIYIIMGPNVINSFGPEYTQMANQHEQDHANDYSTQAASGKAHGATEGEELRIYTRGFTSFFLKLFRINTDCSWEFADDFNMLFESYDGAETSEKDTAFSNLESFYNNTIKGDSSNESKFKMWLQFILNNRGASDALVKRLNALEGLSLKKDTKPSEHLTCS